MNLARTILVVAMLSVTTVACGSSSPPAAAQPPCAGSDGVNGPVPAGARPGDVVQSTEIDSTDADGNTSPGYPNGGRVYRVLYVSTSADESDLVLVCGTVTLPTSGPVTGDNGRTRVFAWAHGTQGLDQRCLPSSNPDTGVWGPMPAGIQTVAWGSLLGKHEGDPLNGQLQYAVDQGWIVATADYQPPDTYIIGRVAAANVLDSIRAAQQLADQQFPESTASGSDVVIAGHSQGGHAALWAAQLADPYLSATGSSADQLRIVGVEALAPAANFVVQPNRQPGTEFGDGLADREMHQSIPLLGLPIPALELQIGPALFSYIFGSWSQYSSNRSPAAGATTPAGPETGPLPLDEVATPEGQATVAAIMPLCLLDSDATKVKQLVSPYRNAGTNQMLVPELWNLPSDYSAGEYFRGGVDRTCSENAASLGGWCEWILWNLPGPLGQNPFPKVPTSDGEPVPLLIAQGTDDTVIHCVAPGDLPAGTVPSVADCMSRALYESMLEEYCPNGSGPGTLQLQVFNKGPNSPADHLSIPGQMAARKLDRSSQDLSYLGSPSQRFVEGAFDGTLPSGCSAEVLNP